MIETLATLIGLFAFWGAVLGLVQTYFLYPIILLIASRFRGSSQLTASIDEYPSVSLIIAAYNEEEIIAEKIENSLELTYPSEKLEIIVFSDASSDRTDEIVGSYADEDVRLMRIEGRVGKTECQNRVASAVESDILVFSDANSMYDPNAITSLVRTFSPEVGCVVGELRYSVEGGVEGESVYWQYEQYIKRLESAVNSLVGANGSIYAVRASSYVPLPRSETSDFAEPLAIVESGEAVRYAANAVAREQTGDSTQSELNRRKRIVTRTWNTLSNYTRLLNPFEYPAFSFQLVSHKLLRWLSPVFLLLTFVSNALLAVLSSSPVYDVTFVLQLLFYGLAVVGSVTDRLSIDSLPYIRVPYYFIVANYGMSVGLYRFLGGTNIVTWETESR